MTKWLQLFALVISTGLLGNALAGCIPGGKDFEQAIEARKGHTALSILALSMSPGTWSKLKTIKPRSLWSAPPPSKGLHIGTWSDDAHWDSRSGQFLFFGVRKTRKFVAYSEEQNAWRVIPFHEEPNAPGLKQKYGHQYSNNALDPEQSRFYTGVRRYDIQAKTWAHLPTPKPGKNSMVYEYFSAMNGLLSLARSPPGILRFYDEHTGVWKKLGVIPVHGYHSVASHNPFQQEVLFGGGNDSRSIVILSKDGSFRKMKDFPERLTVRYDIVTVDPISGNYLFMLPKLKKLYEFDSKKNDYRLVDDFKETPWPFHRYDAPVVAYIPEYDVTMWVDREVHLYKHKSLSSPASVTQSTLSECTGK